MGTPPPGAMEPRALCKSLPAQRPHHPSGAPGLVLLQEGPLDLETVGSCRREQAVQIHGVGGCLPGTCSPAPSAPGQPSPGSQPAQTPGV